MIQETSLERLPQAAFEVRGSTVISVNKAASEQLPELISGSTVPDFLFQALETNHPSGKFQYRDQIYLFTRLTTSRRHIITFLPLNPLTLTLPQIEGFSRQMRDCFSTFLNQIELISSHLYEQELQLDVMRGLSHTFHQMLRLLNNLEFLSIPPREMELLFRPVTLDLAGLCADLTRQTAPLLRKSNVCLSYSSRCTCLLISGDSLLLQRALLALISNAAKFSQGGTISLQLCRDFHKTVLTIADGNTEQVDPLTLLTQPSDEIPQPQQGAGLGLAVAQRIIHLHGGTLLSHNLSSGGLAFVIAFPIRPVSPSLSVQTPLMEYNAGISPLLVELADVLPESVFEIDLPD